MKPKFCKDCKHYEYKPARGYLIDQYLCHKWKTVRLSLVTGREIKEGTLDAFHARELCGETPKYWEPK